MSAHCPINTHMGSVQAGNKGLKNINKKAGASPASLSYLLTALTA
jgi:hypothetical protein